MGKVTKILGKLLSATLLLLIILPLTLSILISLAPIQRLIVENSVGILSHVVGTNISVERVRFNGFNQITIEGIEVDDLKEERMFSAAQITASIKSLSLSNRYITLSELTISNGDLQLREMASDSLLNLKQITNRLSNPNSRGFKIVANKIELDNFDFSLERLEHRNPEWGVDLGYIRLNNINSVVGGFSSFKDVTYLSLEELSLEEQSGLSIESGSCVVDIHSGNITLSRLKLDTPYSSLSMPHLRLYGSSWLDFKDFNNEVSLEIISSSSSLSTHDLAYFAPSLKGTSLELKQLDFTAQGVVSNLEVELEGMNFGGSSTIASTIHIEGLPESSKAHFGVSLSELSTSLWDINSSLEALSVNPLVGQARDIVANLERFSLSGQVDGSFSSMMLDAALQSNVGAAQWSGRVELLGGGGGRLKGVVSSSALNVGSLVNNSALGALWLNSSLAASWAQSDDMDVVASGAIKQFNYKSNTFNDVEFKASMLERIISGEILSHDKNLNFDVSAQVDMRSANTQYDMSMRLRQANLAAMGINHRDSIALLSGSMKLELSGSDFEDLSGSISLRNMSYTYNKENLYAPSVTIIGRNDSQSKYIDFSSDWLDANFSSKNSFASMSNYIKQSLYRYVPALLEEGSEALTLDESTTIFADNYSVLGVVVKDFAPITDAVLSGLSIADNTELNVLVNPFNERFSLRLTSDYIEYNNLAATLLSVNASNLADSLSMYTTASDIFFGATKYASYSLMAGVRNNVVELSTGFRDSLNATSATLGLRATLETPRSASIELLPSSFSHDESVWTIQSEGIRIEESRIEVDDFSIVNHDQRLALSGVASTSLDDRMMLELVNYDISMITEVINDLGYVVEGSSNGFIDMSGVLASPRVLADVKLDGVEVNNIPSPPLHLSAGWNATMSQADVYVTYIDNPDTVMVGRYNPTDGSYNANLRVDSVSMTLIDPLLKSTIGSTRGYADLDIELEGVSSNASLRGSVELYDVKTRVLFSQVEYSLPQATLQIDDNEFSCRSTSIYDRYGNSALVSLDMSLDQLSNVTYNMRIVPTDLLILNTSESNNDFFYGTIFGSGVVSIQGDKRGVNMDISATSSAGSQFFMPLSSSSSVAKTDFITFVQQDQSSDEETINLRRAAINSRRERQSAGSSNSSRLNIDMALHITPDVDLQIVIDPVVGDIIRSRGEGRMNLTISPQDNQFEMYGDYIISEGSYLFTLLNPITKRFTIESGSSIQWIGDPIDPLLDINAVYKVKTSLEPLLSSISEDSDDSYSRSVGVDCIIELGYRLTQPSVSFNIEVPSADTEQQAVISNVLIDQETISQQFLYLMFANSFVAVDSGIGSSFSSSATGFDLLTNQLSNWLSSSNYNVIIRYRPESELTSDEVDVGFSRGLIDNRLLIEVEGNYLADTTTSYGDNVSNFMGEAYITWLIDRAGALRLRGFTQTVDSYDENDGLQETGVGLYYSKSFNRFSDLWRTIRQSFSFRRRKSLKSTPQPETSSPETSPEVIMAEAGRPQTTIDKLDN